MNRRLVVVAMLAVCAAVFSLTGTEGSGTIRFEDVTARAGVDFIANGCPTLTKNQPETMLAGVALIDYDNDGYLDLYFVNGADINSLRKDSDKYKNRLFHNNRDGTFTDVTDKAGVGGDGYDIAAAVGDYDNDGWQDLYVAGVSSNHLYRNNHDGTFSDVTAKAGVGGGVYRGLKMWGASAGWVDYNNDGKLDLFVSNYCRWEAGKEPVCLGGGRLRGYCHPKVFEPLPATLYRNNGDGTFTDVSDQTGIARKLGKGMGVAFNDYDGDGFTDIFVANDNMANSLFHNIGGKRFEEVALRAGVAYNADGREIGGMGAEFRDLDNDGRPDIWHTATELDTFPLFRNNGGGTFTDMTARSGLGKATMEMSGWSNAVGDFDNDGWKDLFVARSNVLDNVAEFSSRSYGEPNSIFRNLGGMKFADVSAEAGPALQVSAAHRGAVAGDLFNDGRLDLVVTVLNGKAKVLRNVTENGGNWVTFQLEGRKSNRMGIGAQVKITTEDGASQYDMVSTSGGYGASRDPRAHFGLGRFRSVREVDIRWPSGARQVLKDVEGNAIHRVREPE